MHNLKSRRQLQLYLSKNWFLKLYLLEGYTDNAIWTVVIIYMFTVIFKNKVMFIIILLGYTCFRVKLIYVIFIVVL